MQYRNKMDFGGSRVLVVWMMMALSSCGLFAKERQVRLVGTVTAIGNDSITIETASHKTLTVKITSNTKFLKHKVASSLGEMKTGVHAVIQATSSEQSSSSTTPSADMSAEAANTQKDTLSLGLSFTATQVSY
ncbi:MAG TPA: hypothetical protein VKZ53_10340 [Candidatus Angelobacter sp.]|nr:hypothetical protein [Candidatus Angelobacter sp.]